jgi:hypothetical protein
MALLICGKSKCSLCGEVIAPDQETVSTTHFIESKSNRLWRYSDSTMHYRCFQNWEKREEFVSLYNATVGQIVWGDGTRHVMAPDGIVRSTPNATKPEIDWVEVSREAHELSLRHGRDAHIFASRMAEKAEAAGDIKAAQFWQAVSGSVAPRA